MKIEADMKVVTKGNLVAVGSITLDEIIRISNVKVVNFGFQDGREDWKVLMPRKKKLDSWTNIINITDPEVLREVTEAVYTAIRKDLLRDIGKQPEIKTEVVVYQKNEILGYAKVTYGGAVEIQGIQIRKGADAQHPKILFPFTVEDNRIDNLVEPMTAGIRQKLKESVTEVYFEAVKKTNEKERGWKR